MGVVAVSWKTGVSVRGDYWECVGEIRACLVGGSVAERRGVPVWECG